MAYISYQGYSRHTIGYATKQYVIHTCSLRLAELTETDYFCTNARIEYITNIDSHCIEQNGEHTERLHLFLFQTVSLKSHTQAESASTVICASVLINFVGYTSRSSHTPSSLLPIAPLVHPDKSGLSIQHHVEVGLSCRETLTLPLLRDLARRFMNVWGQRDLCVQDQMFILWCQMVNFCLYTFSFLIWI